VLQFKTLLNIVNIIYKISELICDIKSFGPYHFYLGLQY
jgi:hypothetical protein